jgi:hypothetical protein
MKSIAELLERNGIGADHPDYELFTELFITIAKLKESIEPFISNDPIKHRINITLRGKVFPFLACQDDQYYLRKAAKLINEKSINA